MRQFVLEGLGISLSRSTCLNYLHRLGFVLKRPKKRLVRADGQKRESFVAEYAALWDEAGQSGARTLFADEAHFRADAELRGKWVLQGEPALVDCSSPRLSGHPVAAPKPVGNVAGALRCLHPCPAGVECSRMRRGSTPGAITATLRSSWP